MRAHRLRIVLHRRRANRLVRVLRIGLRLVGVRLLGHEVGDRTLRPMNSRTSVIACSDDARRIGSHVGDETDRAFARQLDAFVELLRDHHRFLDGESRRLLQLARDERRNRVPSCAPSS